MEWKVSSDKRVLIILSAKPAELSLGTIVSIWDLQVSVLSSVRPRNFVLLIIVTFLLPGIIWKLLEALFLVTNCM
jgi:hypothetical protein